MYFQPKGFFTRAIEAVITFVVCVWLIKFGIGMLEEIWGWILLIAALVIAAVVGWKLYRHYKNTRGF